MANVTAKQVLNKAKSYVGTKEKPAGSNNVIFNTHYYGKPVHGAAYPWCVVFLWFIFKMVGGSYLFYGGKKCAYTPTLANYYKSKNRWYKKPKVGDLVFYKFPGSNRINHVGIVYKVVNSNTIQAIEGNTSTGNDCNGGCVMIRTRSTYYVVGYGRPDYATTVSGKLKAVNLKGKLGKTPSEYTTKKFVKDVETVLGVKNPDDKATKATLEKTVTLSTTKHPNHRLVKYVQKLLKAKGYDCKVTEKYDNQTAAAVKKYQKKHNTQVDGIISAGNVTWKNMLGL